MKKKKLLFFYIWLSSSVLIAQNYQAVKSDRIAFFKNEYGGINCLKIDSVEFTGDSVYYLFPNIQQTGSECYTPYGASWLGFQIISRNNGFTIFLNSDRDSVRIKTNSILNESWVSYISKDSLIVRATLIKHDTRTIFGQIDSAKTIGFQVYDKYLNPVINKLNNMSVIISKNYGLVKTLNFRLFPDFTNEEFDEGQFREYDLIGLSNPKLGVQNLTWFEVFDFKQGDEIHIAYESSFWDFPNAILYDIKNTILKYLERRDYSDSIVYKIEETQIQKKTAGPGFTYAYLHDTIKSIIKPRPRFEKLPGEVFFSNGGANSLSMNINQFLSKTEPAISTTIHPSFDSCWSNCCWDGCFTADEYIKGLGGPYYECSNFMDGGGMTNKLVYYKKGSDTWGTPLVITAVEEDCNRNEIRVYPNPAKDVINVAVPNTVFPVLMEIFNIEGKVISSDEIQSGSFSLSIQGIKPGMYFYRFLKNAEGIKTGKLIIE